MNVNNSMAGVSRPLRHARSRMRLITAFSVRANSGDTMFGLSVPGALSSTGALRGRAGNVGGGSRALRLRCYHAICLVYRMSRQSVKHGVALLAAHG